MTSMTLKGGPELMAFLDTLPQKLARNVLRGGLRAAAMVVAEDAQARATDEDVAAAIGVVTGSKGSIVYSKVRLKGKGSFKGIWMEWGTLPHLISVRESDKPTYKTRHGVQKWGIRSINNAVRRGSLEIAGKFVGPVVHHPGGRPVPFMRPALDAKAEAAVVAFAGYVNSRLTTEGLNAPQLTVDDDDTGTDI
jgi:hypothetical protein